MRYFFLLLSLFSISAHAQDTLITVTEGQILAQVQEIKDYRILYVPYSTEEPRTQSMLKDDLDAIYYEGGMRQYFQPVLAEIELDTASIEGLTLEQIQGMGYADAERYYRNKGAFWGTFASTLGFPGSGIFIGVAVGGAIMLTPINPKVTKLPNPDLYQSNEEYRKGYKQAAEKRKLKEVLKGYAYGVGTQLVVLILLIASF